tara:strand:+ start:671 stop:847 length:177 start_codon:yes stop_codon:yes gene_type:complete
MIPVRGLGVFSLNGSCTEIMEGLLVVDGKKVELILFPSCTSLSPLSLLLLLSSASASA